MARSNQDKSQLLIQKLSTPRDIRIQGTIQISRQPPTRRATPVAEARKLVSKLSPEKEGQFSISMLREQTNRLYNKLKEISDNFTNTIENEMPITKEEHNLVIWDEAFKTKTLILRQCDEIPTTTKNNLIQKAKLLEKLALYMHILHEEYFNQFNDGDGHTDITRLVEPVCTYYKIILIQNNQASKDLEELQDLFKHLYTLK